MDPPEGEVFRDRSRYPHQDPHGRESGDQRIGCENVRHHVHPILPDLKWGMFASIASRASISSIVSTRPLSRPIRATIAKHTATAPIPAMTTTGPPLTAATTFCCAAMATTIGM